MKCRLLLVLSLLGTMLCSAQDASFQHIVGSNPNSTDFRTAFKAAARNHVNVPGVSKLGDDWQMSLRRTMGKNVNANSATPNTGNSCTDLVAA